MPHPKVFLGRFLKGQALAEVHHYFKMLLEDLLVDRRVDLRLPVSRSLPRSQRDHHPRNIVSQLTVIYLWLY